MAVTRMANLAVKVADVDVACAWYEARGFEVRDRMHWNGLERADVFLGPIQITIFDRAIYETDEYSLPDECFLHPALFCDDLDAHLETLPLLRDLLAGKTQIEGRATVYVCRDFTCSLPMTEPADLAAYVAAGAA